MIRYNGVEYSSVAELCRAQNKPYPSVLYRLNHGLSVKRAIEAPFEQRPERNHTNTEVTDHLGNVYASRRKRAAAYGVSYQTVDKRLASGMSLEQALTMEVRPRNERNCKLAPYDHNGKMYSSVAAMIEFYNVPIRIVTSRLRAGWGLEKALTTPYVKRERKHYE
jgi:hypothetical protein